MNDIEGYEVVKILKRSRTDQVYEVRSKRSGQLRVLKVLGVNQQGPTNPTEIDISSTIKYDHILPIYNIMDGQMLGKAGLAIFMDKIPGDLFDMVKAKQLTLQQRLEYLYQIFTAVQVLHDNGYLHLDIKADNALVNNNKAVLMDFGTAVKVDNIEQGITYPHQVGTVIYLPVEAFTRQNGYYHFNDKSDIWTLGHLVLFIISGLAIQPNGTMDAVYGFLTQRFSQFSFRQDIYQQSFSWLPPQLATDLIEILEACFKYDPQKRPPIGWLVNHRVFDSVRGSVTSCPSKEIVYREAPNVEHQSIILEIIELFSREFGSTDLRFFFLSIDLFYRSIKQVENLQLTDVEVRKQVLRRLASTCIWIISKAMWGHHIPDILNALLSWSGGDNYYYRDMETNITVALGGNFLPDYLYEACQGFNHLLMTYKFIILKIEDYPNVDLDAWIRKLGPPQGDKATTFNSLRQYSDQV